MTEEEAFALGRRLAACKRFRPMRGMMDNHGRTWTPDLLWRWTPGVDIPDMRDPATVGCALALVREAWGDPSKLWDGHIEVQRDHQSLFFAVQFQHDADGFLQEQHRGTGQSEAEALVVALEAAP